MLGIFGVRLSRRPKNHGGVSPSIPTEFVEAFQRHLEECRRSPGDFVILEKLYYDVGEHPIDAVDFQCSFAAEMLFRQSPSSILDIGSYRHFILGLLAHLNVTSLDVRDRQSTFSNEQVLTGEAAAIPAPEASFDAVVSLCALEHFGLGRYGDRFDLRSDSIAANEMIRVLRPGGVLILTTTISRAAPALCFNGHRIYSLEMLRRMFPETDVIEERFFSVNKKDWCKFEEVTTDFGAWDVYAACLKKRA
jgi:SAM-dependent methyltransferase